MNTVEMFTALYTWTVFTPYEHRRDVYSPVKITCIHTSRTQERCLQPCIHDLYSHLVNTGEMFTALYTWPVFTPHEHRRDVYSPVYRTCIHTSWTQEGCLQPCIHDMYSHLMNTGEMCTALYRYPVFTPHEHRRDVYSPAYMTCIHTSWTQEKCLQPCIHDLYLHLKNTGEMFTALYTWPVFTPHEHRRDVYSPVYMTCIHTSWTQERCLQPCVHGLYSHLMNTGEMFTTLYK